MIEQLKCGWCERVGCMRVACVRNLKAEAEHRHVRERTDERLSRRGFISMLGSGLLIAAVPEIITSVARPMKAYEFRREMIGLLNEQYAGYKITWVAVADVIDVEVKPIHLSDLYRQSKGEDRGSSSKT